MRAILHVEVRHDVTDSGLAGHARRAVDLPFAPPIGSKIASRSLREPREVVGATFNLDDGSLLLNLGVQLVASTQTGETAWEFEENGWWVSSGLRRLSDQYASASRGGPRDHPPEPL